MDVSSLLKPDIVKTKQTVNNWPHIHKIVSKVDKTLGHSIGIDPGRNFGMTVIHGIYISIYWGYFPKHEMKGYSGIDAYNFIQETVLEYEYKIPAIVEGAAYNSRFGQVGLEEVRFGFFLSLHHLGYDVSIVPPATIRKTVFGKGTQQAMDIWPELNHNAADSLSIALAALKGE